MSLVAQLLRPDLRSFAGYRSARSETHAGDAWLDANEGAHASAVDVDGGLRRYPQPQPSRLRAALATLYGCGEEQLLIGRGSDEAIDLIVRASCTPGRDAVLVTPPVFGMYATCARLQGARLLEVPLVDGVDDFRADLHAVEVAALAQHARVVFLCSPGNPAGAALGADAVVELARRLQGRALVVVDEAYIEFSDVPSLAPQVAAQPNLAVLRTLSKAHALAGLRIGSLVADPLVVAALRRCQAPYPIAVPSAQLAVVALEGPALVATAEHIRRTKIERDALRGALQASAGVRRVYPSQGNFLLARFEDVAGVFERLLQAGVVVRNMGQLPQLQDALRITVGTQEQNQRVVDAVRSLAVA